MNEWKIGKQFVVESKTTEGALDLISFVSDRNIFENKLVNQVNQLKTTIPATTVSYGKLHGYKFLIQISDPNKNYIDKNLPGVYVIGNMYMPDSLWFKTKLSPSNLNDDMKNFLGSINFNVGTQNHDVIVEKLTNKNMFIAYKKWIAESKKTGGRPRKPKVHVGPRGGLYVIANGRKKYISSNNANA